jgi:hypothetical protein
VHAVEFVPWSRSGLLREDSRQTLPYRVAEGLPVNRQ